MISISGRSAPRLIRIGRSTLSSMTTGSDHTRSPMAQPVEPVYQSQITLPNSTRPGPICAMQQTSISAESTAT